MADLPRGTVTFLFTDIASSTRLWVEQARAMPAAYERHDAMLRNAIEAHGGVVYKTIGDAIQAAFPTAPVGVAAALTAQRALQTEVWPIAEQLLVRMALHSGAVDPGPDGDYRSPVLNRMGRLLGAGHGGQVLLSQATMELVRDDLPSDAILQDLGEHQLKDLDRSERIYQLSGPGMLTHFPALRTLNARPNNLRSQPTQFIGRDADVFALRTLLGRPEARLVTVTGPGGMGKTRLSLQIAADLVEHFPDGVWFVDLQALRDPAFVAHAISTVLGVQEAGDRSLMTLLQEYLRERHLLLVLDNFEQVADAAPLVGGLLASCPYLKVLVTSRIRLQLRGEREFPLSPLSLPDPGRLPTLDQLAQYDAVHLFVERATEALPGFTVTSANAAAVADICTRLDGLPLAIELAAARIRILPPEAMLKRLQNRLPLLTGGARDMPERQRTLGNAITWSHDLLPPGEQALFRRLSVFAGGATLEAIEAVAACDELGINVFDGLDRLVDHSLLRQQESSGEPRFLMLETIREYGLVQLKTSGEAEDVLERHAAFFLALVEEAEPKLEGGVGRAAWLALLETEHDNIRAAMRWSLDNAPEHSLRFGAALGGFWTYAGHLREGQFWLEQVLAGVPKPTSPELSRTRCTALLNASYVLWTLGDYAKAQAAAEEALFLARQRNAPELMAKAMRSIAGAAAELGDYKRALELGEQALKIYQSLGDKRGTALLLNDIGVGEFLSHGDLARSATYLSMALEQVKDLGDPLLIGHILINIGELARDYEGDFVRAASSYREAFRLLRESDYRSVLTHALAAVAVLGAMTGRYNAAARILGAKDVLSEEIGAHIPGSEQTRVKDAGAALRAGLGTECFDGAREAGRSLSLDGAVLEAITMADDIALAPRKRGASLPVGEGEHDN